MRLAGARSMPGQSSASQGLGGGGYEGNGVWSWI